MDNVTDASREVLEEGSWRARRDHHHARVDAWVQPHLHRRKACQPHPVEDFLFTYYSHRPAALRRWHPGFGKVLTGEDAASYLELKGYVAVADGVTVALPFVETARPLLSSSHRLLTATADRPAQWGCFGMHEWAMVYGLDQADVRHSAWPLRLGAAGTDEVVESNRIT
ncbi:MAG TPA: 3-methyladenine DNA glycosylase, partial [Nocardioidaceae bacterium]|nr:3-methyladenine DNA glycosylase [Nocardioidaceae bacterium]